MITQRKPLRFPTRADFSSRMLRKIDKLEEAVLSRVPHMYRCSCSNVDWNLHRAVITHPLSEKFLDKEGGWIRGRSDSAHGTSDQYVMSLLGKALSTDDCQVFIGGLQEVCAHLTDHYPRPELRRILVELNPDPNGSRVMFGPWQNVEGRLRELHAAIRFSDLAPAMTSLASLCVLLNIHPFVDGNGRTARALCNAVSTWARGDSRGTVSLKELFLASDGGFELRLRDVEINDNWAPLVDYFTEVHSIIGRNSCESSLRE